MGDDPKYVQPEDVFTLKVNLSKSSEDKPQTVVLYDWFTHIGTPPRAGNKIQILIDGAEMWSSVYADMIEAEHEIQIATWMCRPNIELLRPMESAVSEPEKRESNRFGEILDRKAEEGVKACVLIWGMTYSPILNSWLRKWYWTAQDRIELLEQDHPKLIGSYHQKTITIDGRVGYCGGMNVNENDWDTCDHSIFDPRRNPHSTKKSFRQLVHSKRKKTKFPPRHDLAIRLEGPVVNDIIANFSERWNDCLAAINGAVIGRIWQWFRCQLGHEPAKKLPSLKHDGHRPNAFPGGATVQIARTTPKGEEGILDLYCRAIRNARRYIYIENQYFRSSSIAKELADVCRKNPKLHIIALVWPINEGKKSLIETTAYWTAKTQDAIREVKPDFRLTRVLSSDKDADGRVTYVNIDMHSKVLIIDDVWLTLGSANINERGFKFEAEINAAILNKEAAKGLRIRLMAEHLKVPDIEVSEKLDGIDDAFELWREHCEANVKARKQGKVAQSNVHCFVQQSYNFPAFLIGESVF